MLMHTDRKSNSTEETLKQLRHVASMVMRAAEEETLEQMLQQIVDIARDLIGVRYAALGVPDHKGGLRFFKVSGISREELAKIHHPPVGLGLLGSIMESRETVRLPNMHNHPHAVGFPVGHPKMTSLLGVPIQLGDQLYGIFYLTDRHDGKPFSEDDQWMLEIMAGYAALVIAEKHLHDQRRQIALMREREQIGMTLHDSVIQSIYALGMRLDLAKRRGTITSEDIDTTLDGLNHVIEEIRGAIFHLKEQNKDGLTLRRRLSRVATQLYVPPELDISFTFPEHSMLIDEDVLETLEMMVSECLSNVIRHARARNVVIQAHDGGDRLEVIVKDDGIGFDTQNLTDNQGLGLRNLERRARIHGGSVQILSVPNQGTTIQIQIPLD